MLAPALAPPDPLSPVPIWQVSPTEYDLVLNCDVNTRGHTQWFYFGIARAVRGHVYKFNVVNCVKPDSLFNCGMQPLVYSSVAAETHGVGWRRQGFNVCYYQNHIRRRSGYYYTLSFQLRCGYDDDIVFVAYCEPYTLSDFYRYIKTLEDDPSKQKRFRRRTLCETLAGNTVEVLTVTSFTAEPEALKARKGVVISARVHPGESNASFMMQGIIDYLVGPSLDAKILRDNFVFKLVPMLNPDGVILGNYRCGLSGVDLNRQWHDPSEVRMPTIFHTKRLIKSLAAQEQLLLFCDLHGHSRKRNIFMYGCENTRGPLRLRERVFPRLLADCCPHFSLPGCSFKVLRSKENTGRVVVCRQFGLPSSYTLEASFCGADFGQGVGVHFNTAHLREMGAAFVPALLDMAEPTQARVGAILAELECAFPLQQDADDDDDEGGGGDRAEGGGGEAATRRPARGRRAAAAPKAVPSSTAGRRKSQSPPEAVLKAAAKKKPGGTL
mmetsp:Transcript_86716/g.260334  ORF Transcript_86716/g.260334 Transcript_86716/m.260334 type:complete len:496 (-) Transcript_86716:75-1562(-)